MRLKILLLLCLVFPLLTGWGHWGPQVKIGFAVDNAQGREGLIKSMKEEMEDNRADLVLRDAKGNASVQQEQVKDLIAQGIQALIVIPVDAPKAGSLVQAAHQAGIKVISLERLIPNSGLDYLVSFNEMKAGKLQAGAMAKKVSQGRYVLLGSNPSILDGRIKELQPLSDKGIIHIVIVASRNLTGTKISKEAAEELKKILKATGNEVDAVLAADSEAVEGAATALSKSGLSGKIQVAGIGEDLGTCQRIASGKQALTIYYPPKKLAAESAYLAAKLARKATQFDCQFTELDNGSSKTMAVLLTPLVVDAKNLDSTIIADGVQKKEEVYGKKP